MSGGSLPAIAVRIASAGDCEAIASVEAEVNGIDAARAFARCVEQTADPAWVLVLAEAGGEVVGFGRAARWEPPEDAPANAAPAGWYLLGLDVRESWRRRGAGLALTSRRLEWIAERADRAYYFANARNDASIGLHRRLGFVERTRDFWFPRMRFDGGEGILFEVALRVRGSAPARPAMGARRRSA